MVHDYCKSGGCLHMFSEKWATSFMQQKPIVFSFPIIFQNLFIYQICTAIHLTENIYGWHITIKASGLKPQSDLS